MKPSQRTSLCSLWDFSWAKTYNVYNIYIFTKHVKSLNLGQPKIRILGCRPYPLTLPIPVLNGTQGIHCSARSLRLNGIKTIWLRKLYIQHIIQTFCFAYLTFCRVPHFYFSQWASICVIYSNSSQNQPLFICHVEGNIHQATSISSVCCF